ncbi:hypothetical protein F2P81_009490 [Scophthalmus maximus]|uniref:Uncharacterized protein n=1 Tax=Scophthalmus maximus TaxID=52904 RepID=A0A6A4SUV3_SCOMX|nr:hypothetical protein F2P81_009490 [Scophthalmus maximus]
MMSQVDDDNSDMDSDNWTNVGSQRGRGNGGLRATSLNNKRGLEENSLDEGRQVVRKKVVREGFKIIIKFKTEDVHIPISPINLAKELKKKIGDVEMAKILRDGSLLVKVKTEEQKNKTMRVENICKKIVNEKIVLGEKKVTREVITCIPVEEDLERLKKSMVGETLTK